MIKKITYNIKFVDTCRLMPSKLSDLVDNLSEMERKHIKQEREFIGLKNNRLNYRCNQCKETSSKSINELIKKFPRMSQFCNGDLNKIVLLLRKGVYPYEYMDSWEIFNETSLPLKKIFHSELNLVDITDKDYNHAQNLWKVFEINNLGEYHDLYVQTDTLLLLDVFEKFRDKCIEIYELNPSYFYSAPGLAGKVFLKETEVKLELLNRLPEAIND